MRCRRARSYLSAYCSDELNGRRKLAVSEHLSTCASCRKEEAFYRSLSGARSSVSTMKVSKDFNGALLNRIAQERFAETRTKAYMPHSARRVVWAKVLPVVVSTCVVAFMAAFMVSPSFRTVVPGSAGQVRLDDSYLTVQPTKNPNMTVSMHKGWSLDNQLARVQRVNDITNSVTRTGSFAQPAGMVLTSVTSRVNSMIPYAPTYYRYRPIIKVYVLPEATSSKEASRTY